jgi:hypothetical protein
VRRTARRDHEETPVSDVPPAREPRREREVVVNDGARGGGGGAVAAIIAVVVLLIILFVIFGTGLFGGDGDNGDTTIEAPEVEAPDTDVTVENGDDGATDDGGDTETDTETDTEG